MRVGRPYKYNGELSEITQVPHGIFLQVKTQKNQKSVFPPPDSKPPDSKRNSVPLGYKLPLSTGFNIPTIMQIKLRISISVVNRGNKI